MSRVKGHTLAREGFPHTPGGRPIINGDWYRTSGDGHARCSCGELSPLYTSTNARRRWHRQHKEEVVTRDTQTQD